MDLGGGCGTIALPMSASRWIRLLVLVGLVAFSAPSAHGQVFKPRGNSKPGTAIKTAPPAPAATPATSKKAAPATTPAAATSKKPTRATGTTPRRVVTTTPAKKSRKGREDADTVVVDDDDDDVKITDD